MKLFVYGTLRIGGEANYLMADAVLVQKEMKVYGYSLYDYGPYPFALKAHRAEDFLIGDVFEVSSEILISLDDYEGELYQRHFDEVHGFYIYICDKLQNSIFPKIISCDWFDK